MSKKGAKRCQACYLARKDIPSVAKTKPCSECGKPLSTNAASRCADCYRNRSCSPSVEQTPQRDVELSRWKDTAKRYRKLYEQKTKDDVEEQRLIQLFHTSIDALPSIPAPMLKAPTVKPSARLSHETPVLAFGDLHVGQVVELQATHGINEYNFDVWQNRLEYLEGRVLDILFTHQTSHYDEIVVAGLGDNVSGLIHEELQKYGAQHIIDQVVIGATAVSVFLARLSAHFKRVRYVGISGNHGRTSKQKESVQYYKNFDYLWNAQIATRLRSYANISVEIPKAIFTVMDVADHRILVSHGMELPPSSMGLPAYSINRAAGSYQEILRMVQEHYDYWILGHVHRPMELDASIVNGCFSGFDEYSVGKLFKPIRPMQKLLGFHKNHGLTWHYPIQLHKAPQASVYRFSHDMGVAEVLDAADAAVGQ